MAPDTRDADSCDDRVLLGKVGHGLIISRATRTRANELDEVVGTAGTR